jgi:translation initiation factor IF-2
MTIVTRSLADGAGAALLFLLLVLGVGNVRTSHPDAESAGEAPEPLLSPEAPGGVAALRTHQSHTVRVRPTGPAAAPEPQTATDPPSPSATPGATDSPGPQPAVDAPGTPTPTDAAGPPTPAEAEEPPSRPAVPVGNGSRMEPSDAGARGPVTWRGESGID